MLTTISAGIGSLQSAAGLIKTLNAAITQAKINEVQIGLQNLIIEAQGALAAAQMEQTTALSRIDELEDEIMRLKDWETEKQRYQLKAIDRASFAFRPKPGMENGEPPHWLCANCFGKRQKSFLQHKGRDESAAPRSRDYAIYGCDSC